MINFTIYHKSNILRLDYITTSVYIMFNSIKYTTLQNGQNPIYNNSSIIHDTVNSTITSSNFTTQQDFTMMIGKIKVPPCKFLNIQISRIHSDVILSVHSDGVDYNGDSTQVLLVEEEHK